MSTANIYILISIIAYLILVIGIGIFYAKRNNSTKDFYLGGRTLGPFVTAMSAEASDMSGWLLMGLPGVAYASGMDSNRSRHRYIYQLAYRCQKT